MEKTKAPQHEAFTLAKHLTWSENILFILSYLYSIGVFGIHNEYALFCSLLFTFAIFIVSVFKANYFLKGSAQKIDYFLDDSFGQKRSGTPSEEYYDNSEIELGMKRMLANIHENLWYTSEISKVMNWFHGMLSVILIIVFVFLLSTHGKERMILLLLNFMVSGNVLIKTLSVLQLKTNTERLFDETNKICARYEEFECDISKVERDIISLFVKYETLLVDTKVNLWSFVFNRKNHELEKKWNKIKKPFKVYDSL